MFAADYCHRHYHNHHHRHMMVITTTFEITVTVSLLLVCDPQSVLALLRKQRERPKNFRPEWDSKSPQKIHLIRTSNVRISCTNIFIYKRYIFILTVIAPFAVCLQKTTTWSIRFTSHRPLRAQKYCLRHILS